MTVKQISVFVENKAGKLSELTNILRQRDIDMRALSIAANQNVCEPPVSFWYCAHHC